MGCAFERRWARKGDCRRRGRSRPTTAWSCTAVIRALESLQPPSRGASFTDSQYVRRGILEWVAAWKARGWLTADRKPVKNQDLWQRLERACRAHTRSNGTGCRATPAYRATSGSDRLANQAIDALVR